MGEVKGLSGGFDFPVWRSRSKKQEFFKASIAAQPVAIKKEGNLPRGEGGNATSKKSRKVEAEARTLVIKAKVELKRR